MSGTKANQKITYRFIVPKSEYMKFVSLATRAKIKRLNDEIYTDDSCIVVPLRMSKNGKDDFITYAKQLSLKIEIKPPNRKQNNIITIRMKDDDYNLFRRLADKSQLSQTEFIRRAVLSNGVTVIPGIADLIPELKRIGNNLNQITRAVNKGYSVEAERAELTHQRLHYVFIAMRLALANKFDEVLKLLQVEVNKEGDNGNDNSF